MVEIATPWRMARSTDVKLPVKCSATAAAHSGLMGLTGVFCPFVRFPADLDLLHVRFVLCFGRGDFGSLHSAEAISYKYIL